jgi:hypothetical protein
MTFRVARAFARILAPGAFTTLLALGALALSAWSLPYELPSPDAGAVLTQSMKLARGAVFYRDLDAYPFPAAPYLLGAAMRLFGEHLMVGRALGALTFLAVVLAGYRLALEQSGRRAAAAVGVWLLTWKFVAHPAFHDTLYPDVALAFGMWSMVLFLRFRSSSRLRDLFWTGVLVAMAVLSKQNLGLYLGAAMGILLLSRRLSAIGGRVFHPSGVAKELAVLAGGVAVPIAATLVYFHHHGVLEAMLYSGFVRPFLGYLPTSGLSFLVPLKWWELGHMKGQGAFAYAIVPLFSMLSAERLPPASLTALYWLFEEIGVRLVYTGIPFLLTGIAFAARRRWTEGAEVGRTIWLAALAMAAVASAFPRADFYHIAGIYPVVLVLAAVGASRLLFPLLQPRATAVLHRSVIVITASGFALSLSLTAAHHHSMTYEAGNARGRMWIDPAYAWIDDVIHFLDANLREDDPLFVYGHEAYYYFFTGRYASWPFVQLYPGMTGDPRGRDLVESLRNDDPPFLVRGILAGWPGLEDVGAYAPELKSFVDASYSATDRPFGDALPPDSTAPPRWLCSVMERKVAFR